MPFRFNPFTDKLDLTETGGPGLAIQTITGNSGGPIGPDGSGNINILTANSTVKFVGSGNTETLNFGLDVLLLGSSGSSISGAATSVGVGLDALKAITSGSRNVALGGSCMAKTTSGVQNVAAGFLALNSNTIGSNSVAIGYNALNAATGGGNTAIGAGALTSIVSAGQCVAVGFSALGNVITTGHTGVGYAALAALTAGSGSNTALGGSAGINLLTGAFNILIGEAAGANYTSSESSNIIVGNPGVATESNVVRIGVQGSMPGQQDECFMAGITGATAVGSPVAISSTGQLSDLGFGSIGQVLTSNGSGVSPTWQPADATYVSGVYGDASDGMHTFDGTTTILGLVPSSSTYTLTRDLFLGSSTINSGVSIITDGYRLFCNGTLTNNGTIKWDGNNGVLNAAGAATTNANASFLGANTGSAGGAGGTTNGTAGTNQSNSPLALGALGGAGGNGTGTGQAAGTISTRTTQLGSIRYLPAMVQGFYFSASGLMTILGGTGGGGGGGDTVNAGGGGGSGGGIVLIVAHAFAGTGAIQALGGNGGNGAVAGTNCGGGGGGGGGALLITSSSVSGGAISGQTLSVAGGNGGSPTGSGVMGSPGGTGNIVLLSN